MKEWKWGDETGRVEIPRGSRERYGKWERKTEEKKGGNEAAARREANERIKSGKVSIEQE